MILKSDFLCKDTNEEIEQMLKYISIYLMLVTLEVI